MIWQQIHLFFRRLVHNQIYYLVLIIGLTVGLAAVVLAFASIQYENEFDKIHEKGDNIFRVNKQVKEQDGSVTRNAETPGLMAAALMEDFPEVVEATRLAPWFDEVALVHEDSYVATEKWVFADESFFELFDFELLTAGDPSKLLLSPGQILITPSIATVLFGSKEAVGQTIRGLQDKEYTVAGIVEEAPRQSHIQFDVIASWSSTDPGNDFLNYTFFNNWLGQTVYTYVSLDDPLHMDRVNRKLDELTKRYMENRHGVYHFYLQPFAEIYLNSTDLLYLRGGKYGSALFLRTFALISLLVLLIACFNYINTSTARSLQRAKEIGIRKVIGADRKQLIAQFLAETFAVLLVSGVFAWLIAYSVVPVVNQWFGMDIPTNYLVSVQIFLFLLGTIAIATFFSGLLPGILLTKLPTLTVLRDSLKLSPAGELPRRVLIVLQLAIAIGLIATTLTIQSQFRYVLRKDLGFSAEEIIVVNNSREIIDNHRVFKRELENIDGIVTVSMCNAVVGEGTFGSTVIPEGMTEEFAVQMFRIDTNYLETFGMEIIEGRFLNLISDHDDGPIIVNETFARLLGWEDPLNKTIRFHGSEKPYPIVGVIKDFHFSSLHEPIGPVVMYLDERKPNTSIRVSAHYINGVLPRIRQLWENLEPRHPFNYYFLNDYFAEKYYAEKRMLMIITIFSSLAIGIACMGLYGLVSYLLERRQKEIGIRKVLGASVSGIVKLVGSRFIILVLVAFAISAPLAYLYSNSWLAEFTYQIDTFWHMIALAGIIVLLIVLVTVGGITLRAAKANPVHAIRGE